MRVLLLCSLLLVSACESSGAKSAATLTYTEDAHKAYKEALRAYEDKEWETARALFSEVKRLFAYSKYARLAELRMADIDFEQSKFSDAISSYRAFIKGHRGDQNVEYARYRIAKALFLDVSDTILLPSQEERDQANARDAHRELGVFVKRYPQSRYRVEARYMLEVVTQRLVRHELYVARYYLREDNFEATVARVDYALANFAGSGLDAECLVLKGETLLKMHEPEAAREVFEGVIADYGGPFGQVAQRFLEMMDRKGPSPAQKKKPKAPPDGAPRRDEDA
jgi:outer membrane protein assembly factor BamD